MQNSNTSPEQDPETTHDDMSPLEQKKIRNSCSAGFLAIGIAGSLLHFAYPWSNQSPLVAPWAPVNESVWEHLKLGYWGMLLFIFLEFPLGGKRWNNYAVSRVAAVLLQGCCIVGGFYTYTALLGDNALWADISLYFAAVAAGQYLAYRLLTAKEYGPMVAIVSLWLLAAIALLFAAMTYFPPEWPLFRDSLTGRCGLG